MALITLFQGPPGAQQTPAPVFKTKVDLVQVDVSVLDKNRRPVRGLTQADFTVFEDGKTQTITIFEPVDVPDPEPPPVAWMRDVTPDVTTNEERVTRLWVIAVDDGLIPTDPWIIKSSRKVIEDIIDKLGPEDLATIVFTADSRKAQDFTNDKTKLRATLDKFNPGFATWTEGNLAVVDARTVPLQHDSDVQFMLGSINTLKNVLETLAVVPNSHKSLIWVTPGIPMDSTAVVPLKAPVPTSADGGSMELVMSHRHLIDRTKEIFDLARLANVPVYPIDPCGMGGLEAWLQSAGRATAKAPRSMDHILMTAANTGGHAIVNTNDFTPGINSIFEENGSYYQIGYYPTNANDDGTLRKLQVKVNRNDVDVRTKSGYVAPKRGAGPPTTTGGRLATAIAAPIPVTELPMRAAVAPFAIPGGRNAAVTIALGVRQPVPEAAATGRMTVSTDLQVTAFTTEGDNKGTQRTVAKVVLRAGAQGDADYEALSRIDLPPGRYRLRLAAYHEAALKTGTVMADVLVPDFNRDAASMSGVVLGATPGRPSAPRDLFTDILPIVPTAQRAFTTKDKVTALFDLYQNAGKGVVPARVAIRVTDAHGTVLVDDAQNAGIDRFVGAQSQKDAAPAVPTTGGARSIPSLGAQQKLDASAAVIRAAEFQYKLPIERLPPGRYLLTFQATVGASVLRRDVIFEIKP